MSLFLECKKAKRTGFLPAFLGGGILAGAVPIVNMTVRAQMYLTRQGSPVQILLEANWQLMAMLNILLVVSGACLLYHTEYADGCLQKMKSLPIAESSLFLGKAALTILTSLFMLGAEAGAILFCSYHWFGVGDIVLEEICRNFAYSFLLTLPCIFLSLLISEACRNMWVSLGIGMVCVFTATMLPGDNFLLSLFPFALPFQIFAGAHSTAAIRYICAAASEAALICGAEIAFVKLRRVYA